MLLDHLTLSSLTSHCPEQVGAGDCGPVKGRSCKEGGSVATLNTGLLDLEVKNEIEFSIAVNVRMVASSVNFRGLVLSKLNG